MITEGLSTVTDRLDYDAWGIEYPISSSTEDNPYRYVGQLGYYTHWQDEALEDLLQLGVRFYEPGVGRFGQRDALGGETNWYWYAGGLPTGSVDPLGLKCTPIGSWEPDPNPGYQAPHYEDRVAWRFLDWHPMQMTAGRGCYCHWIRGWETRWRLSSRQRRRVSCMYYTNCGWDRRHEYEYRDVPAYGPWTPSPTLTMLGSADPCANAQTTRGVIVGQWVPGDEDATHHVWCTCQLKPPSVRP